jgi:DNA-binding transcriptional regulator YdaS (Cro superfamily)
MPRTEQATIPPAEQHKRLIRFAITVAGGTVKMAEALGYATPESVRKFYATGADVPAEKARAFVGLAGGAVNLAQVRPDLYAGLTVSELGYAPRAGKVKARK